MIGHKFKTPSTASGDPTKLQPVYWGREGQDLQDSPTHEFTGGANGSLVARETADTVDGLAYVPAAEGVLASTGAGQMPAFTPTPTLAGLTIEDGGTVDIGETADVAIRVASSGGDFTTLAAALDSLQGLILSEEAIVVITIADGTYTMTSPIQSDHYRGAYIYVQGEHTYSKTLSSVQSSSGSSGAWSLVLNVNSVANIAVGDYVTCTNPSGGTLPTYLTGCHEVTNVDAVNTRITIASKHKNATAPSGAVTGTLTVLKTVLKFNGCDGFRVWTQGGLNLDNLAVVGDGTAGMNGLSVQDLSRLYITTIVGVAGFGLYGVFALYGSEINGATIVSSGSSTGFSITDGSVMNLALAVASGNSIGAEAQLGGVIKLFASTSTGNTSYGYIARRSGTIHPVNGVATGNGAPGFYTEDVSGFIDLSTATGSTNGSALWTLVANGLTIGSLGFNISTLTSNGLTIGEAARQKSLAFTTSSPFDQFLVRSIGSTGGWQGVVDLQASYNAGTLRTGLRVLANTDGASATALFPFAEAATPAAKSVSSSGVALGVTAAAVEVTTDGDSNEDNGTLANGTTVGQVIDIYVAAVGNAADSFKITPATMVGGTKISFAANCLGKGARLRWTASGWVCVATNGGVVS